MEPKATWVPSASLVIPVPPETLACRVWMELLERKVTAGTPVCRVRRALQGSQVPRVPLDGGDPWDRWGARAVRARRVPRDNPAQRGHPGRRGPWGHRGRRDSRALKDCAGSPALPVNKVCWGLRDKRDHPALWVLWVCLASRETPATREIRATLD